MKIGLLGDIAFKGQISEQPEYNIGRYAEIATQLRTFDILVANLEVPLFGDGDLNPLKKRHFYSDEYVTRDLLARLNINVVSLANNHILDQGLVGLSKTISMLKELRIHYSGAGLCPEDLEPAIIPTGDGRFIHFLSYVHPDTNPYCEFNHRTYVNIFDVSEILDRVKEIKSKNFDPIIILSLHWGVDYSNLMTNFQVSVARKFIENGVDLILGHHPHTLQPFELYKGKYIFYSLGTFTFGETNTKTIQYSLPKKAKFSVIPCMNGNLDLKKFIPIRELRNNVIVTTNFNYHKWSKRMNRVFTMTERSRVIKGLFMFKESFVDHLIEYFFGYNYHFKRNFNIVTIFQKTRRTWLNYQKRLKSI